MFLDILAKLSPAQATKVMQLMQLVNRGIITECDNVDGDSTRLYNADCQCTFILKDQLDIECDMLTDDLDPSDPNSLRELADAIELRRIVFGYSAITK